MTGSASIQVLDPAGAGVVAAKAILTSKDRGTKLELTSNSEGTIVVPDLPPGDYSISVQKEGFKTATTAITIRVGVSSSLVLNLEVGAVSTEVVVQAAVVTADTAKSTVQGVIQSDQIQALPLNGRNFLDLAQMAPGVQIVDGGQFDPTKNQMVGVSIGGRGGRVTRIQMDGVDITDETVGTTVMNLTNESIQEFGIQQSSLDLSTDLTSSGAVNIITRSGTNTYHGTGFGLFRRSDFAASTAPLGVENAPKPPFSRDNYGGRLGGYFLKNRLFWDAEYEKLQQQSATVTNVPNFPQFTNSYGVPMNEHMGGARADFSLTDKMKLFYRFMHDDNLGVTGFGGVGVSAFANSNNANSHVAGWDYSSGSSVHSIRFSSLKFANGIVDANALAGTPVLPVQVNIQGLGGFVYGPNANAPQATYQQNRQIKYDGSFVKGRHTLQVGVQYNRITQGGFASFFGLGPRIRAPFSGGVAADPYNADGADDPLNYKANLVILGNGLGALSEKPAFGFPHGGFDNNRFGIYVHDTWKLAKNFTVNGGLRWNFDDGLANADLARTPLISEFDPELGGKPRNDKKRFAPQLGFAWDLHGDGKTVIRGGGGLYYDTNIFNNLSFDRQVNLPPGFGNSYDNVDSTVKYLLSPIDGSILFDFTTQCTGAQPSSGTPNSCFGAAIGNVIPFALQAQQLYQQASTQASNGWPQPGVPPLFDSLLGVSGGAILDPRYKSPYGTQINFGIQRELKQGLVLSVDYIMNRGVHFYETRDRNRIGAANTLDPAAALNAMNLTFNDYECGEGSVAANIDCVIDGGGSIYDFTAEGLGAGSALDGGSFVGNNKNFRSMTVIEYAGVSRYQALQAALTGRIGSYGPLRNVTTNVTYALSRFNSSSTDQDFLFAAVNNDNLTQFYGPSNLDRTHQLGVAFSFDLPAGFRFSTISQYRTNEASTGIFAQSTDASTDIFINDFNGDGTVGDPLPGTNRGAYGRKVHANNLNDLINSYNNNVAGTLTPAGKALVDAGLFTQSQLEALGAVAGSLDPAPAGQIDNPGFYTTDFRLSWTYKLAERFQIEPMVECFNVFNRMNGVGTGSDGRGGNTALDGILSGAVGSINGTIHAPQRVGAGSGSFSSGLPRAFQFGIRVSF
ncbi:MAG: TonB-dependent receptor [Acidobacteria bacterium]|nr:TonB-dependent receptor [Acidobacteriota bacterium]